METLIIKIKMVTRNFTISAILILGVLIQIAHVPLYSQEKETLKGSGALNTFLGTPNSTQTQFVYALELFPDQIFQGWFFYWTNGTPLTANFQENPDVSWLSISPTAFTSNSCDDIVPVAYNFVAPTIPGTYTTKIEDLNGNWDDTNVTLTVTNSPTPYDSVFIQISSGQTITLLDTLTWKGNGNFGCVNNFIPDSTRTYGFSTNPDVSWFTIRPSNFTVFLNDTMIVEKVFTADTLGVLSTYEIAEATWSAWPRFTYFTLDFTTAIRSDGNLPTSFELSQNYPNPFNPSTNIEYSIPSESFVELKVYDVLGNEVATLVNEQQQAGVYRADFNAANLPSGMYFARITANEFTQVVKMTLLK